MTKKVLVLIGLIIASLSLTACLKQKQIKPVYLKAFWGTKQKCIEFLQSDKAHAQRWIVESLGE